MTGIANSANLEALGFVRLRNEKRDIVVHSTNRNSDLRTLRSIGIGSRFKMSALGAARSPRLADKEGIIIGYGRVNSSIRVLFDGSKCPISLHRDYIEQIPSKS